MCLMHMSDVLFCSKVEHIIFLAVLKLDLHGKRHEAMYENLFYSDKGLFYS